MTAFVVFLFVAIFSLDYLAVKLEVISRFSVLVPELLSGLAVVLILGRGLATRRWQQSPKYALVMLIFVLVCLIGIAAEGVAPGPIVAGIRNYFKFLPFFFLPAVYPFQDRQLRILLVILLLIAALQVPLSIFQRFVQFADRMHTGDPITGTATVSSALSMVMMIAVAAVVSLYTHGKRNLWFTLVLVAFLLVPTTINETKGTAVMLPIAIMGPLLLARGIVDRKRRAVPILMVLAVALLGFVVMYNSLIQFRWGGVELQEFLDADRTADYLYRGADDERDKVSRFDSVVLAVNTIKRDGMRLWFGFGIGNVSKSFIEELDGKYAKRYESVFGLNTIGDMLWETGVLGLLVFICLFWLVFRDALRVSAGEAAMQWLGTWWATSICILGFALLYKPILVFNEIAYPMYFWSGVIASRAYMLKDSEPDVSVLAKTRAPAFRLGVNWKEASSG